LVFRLGNFPGEPGANHIAVVRPNQRAILINGTSHIIKPGIQGDRYAIEKTPGDPAGSKSLMFYLSHKY